MEIRRSLSSTEDGTIVGWNAGSGTNAEVKADRFVIPGAGTGAVYKGLAIGSNASGNFLYATDFSTGAIDVFDKNFALVQLPGSFADPNLRLVSRLSGFRMLVVICMLLMRDRMHRSTMMSVGLASV